MLAKFVSSALLFFALTQGAIAVACGDPPLIPCPSFAPCAQATNSAALHAGAVPSSSSGNYRPEIRFSNFFPVARTCSHEPMTMDSDSLALIMDQGGKKPVHVTSWLVRI
ncbi:hypothetical protein FB451DRAFT_1461031 [Mycena latifolia]|nr:hypothetical protein FB451DRAFT_1461031 [Mycena latifolia]